MTGIDIEKSLKQVFAFSELSDSQLSQVATFCSLLKLKRNQMVFSEGQNASDFFVIGAGKIKVYKISPEGKEQTIHILQKGDLLAEAAIFDIKTYPANAIPLSESSLVKIDRNKFVEFLQIHPDASMKLLAAYSKKLRQLVSLVEDLSLNDIKRRFAKYLLNNMVQTGDINFCCLNISKKELATFLGTTPESLSRVINFFKRDNLILLEGDNIQVIDITRLEMIISA